MKLRDWLPLLLGLFLLGCAKEENYESLGIDCIRLRDATGEAMGTFGDCSADQDWDDFPLQLDEITYLKEGPIGQVDAPDNLEVTSALAFPNPVVLGEEMTVRFVLNTQADFIARIAVVDEFRVPIFSDNLQGQGPIFQLRITPRGGRFSSGQMYRLYYQLLGREGWVFYEGYGDFLICPGSGGEPADDCF